MPKVLIQAVVYVVILLIGYIFKKLGIFKVSDTKFLKSLIIYITMPAMVVNGLKDLVFQISLLWAFALGVLTCLVLTVVGMAVTRKSDYSDRVVYIYSMNSFNIGNFAIPFLTGLISTNGFAAICVLDIATSSGIHGLDIALVENLRGGGNFSLKRMLKKVFSAPIVVAYIVMVILSAANIRLPEVVLKVAEVVGNANAFLAMLSIGILFELSIDKKDIMEILKFFGCRYGIAVLLAGLAFFLPLPLDIRIALCVVLMAPVASVTALYTEQSDGDGAKAAQLNSLSIIVGIVMMVVMYSLLSGV